MTNEQQEGWMKFLMMIVFIIGAIVLAATDHENAAGWCAVGAVWVFFIF